LEPTNISKVKNGCALLAFHLLLYCGGCALFFIAGIAIATSHIRLSSAADVVATAGSFLILFPAWILFTVLWVLIVVTIRNIRKKMVLLADSGNKVEGAGITKGELARILAEGREKSRLMRSLAQRAPSGAIRDKICAIADSSNRIYDYLEREPAAARQARQFLNYYDDAALTIVKKYTTIASGHSTGVADATLRRVESSLDSINESFARQYEKLLDGSLTEIEVELSLLKTTLKSEGLS